MHDDDADTDAPLARWLLVAQFPGQRSAHTARRPTSRTTYGALSGVVAGSEAITASGSHAAIAPRTTRLAAANSPSTV